jgi:hypothetical protein
LVWTHVLRLVSELHTMSRCLHSRRQSWQSNILNPPIWVYDNRLLSEMAIITTFALNGKRLCSIYWFRWYQHDALNRSSGWDQPLFALSVALLLIQYAESVDTSSIQPPTVGDPKSRYACSQLHRFQHDTKNPRIWAHVLILLSETTQVVVYALDGIATDTVHCSCWYEHMLSLDNRR